MIKIENNYNRDRKTPVDLIKDQFAANENIRHQSVRVLDLDGESLGILDTKEAQRIANNKGYDLVMVSPTANPPVAKICDYSKFIYEQKRKAKEQNKKMRENAVVIKEIQLRPVIGQHDLEIKLNHAREWLTDNCKIKVTLKFRGRETAHKDMGFAVINAFLTQLGSGKIEKAPELNSNTIIAMVAPGNDPRNNAQK
jgi:translation initiation factor IF-3